ncbi:MAG: PPOX class F420-dependent oxidoreductase [Nitrospinae bacterium]|nr:PPOX class F420-dependent oxidoreductase [Nitrospinota bacterium]
MTHDEALAFLSEQHYGVLSTLLADGRSHPTPIVFDYKDGVAEISMTRGRVKARNLERDPRATLCVMPQESFYPYLCAEGEAELVEDPDGTKNLDLYRRITGKDPDDLDEYLQAMKNEKRLVARLRVTRMYPVN